MEPQKQNCCEVNNTSLKRESTRIQPLVEAYESISTDVAPSYCSPDSRTVRRKSASTSALSSCEMDELPLPLAVRDISSSSSPQFLEKSDAWSHFHAEVQEACRSMIEKKPDRSSWWDWLLGRGYESQSTFNNVYEEIEFTNQVMRDIMSLWSRPPSEEEIKVHHDTMGSMNDKQKKALTYLENIINDDKKGMFLLTKNSPNTSNLDKFSLLMSDDWCHPKDLKTFEVPVTEELLEMDKNDPKGEQRFQEYSNKIKMYLTEVLKADPSNLFVQPPKIQVVNYALQAHGGFRVHINAAKMAMADTINLAPDPEACKPPLIVHLSKIDKVKRDQIPILKLDASDFDTRGDFHFPRANGDNQTRGKMPYKQPTRKWVRVGLKVRGRYDNGNDDWLMMNGNPNEWAIGFHGSRTVEGNQGIASSREIRPGARQLHKNDKDVNSLSDKYNKSCGTGSYFADDIEISARGYGGSINERKCVFQARLKPSKVRIPGGNRNYRIVNETEYARPYGICIKYDS